MVSFYILLFLLSCFTCFSHAMFIPAASKSLFQTKFLRTAAAAKLKINFSHYKAQFAPTVLTTAYATFSDPLKSNKTSFSMDMITPGQSLKSPGEIIKDIKEFRTRIARKEEDEWRQKNNKPQEYRKETRIGEKLVSDALFAHFLCDTYVTTTRMYGDNKIEDETRSLIKELQEQNFIRQDQFNPPVTLCIPIEQHIKQFKKMLQQEEEKIIADCAHCKEYKKELAQQIKALNGIILYRKSYEWQLGLK